MKGALKAFDGGSSTARSPARLARRYTLHDPELAEQGQAARGLCGWQIGPGGSRHRALEFPGPPPLPGRAQPESCGEATGWLSCWGPPPHPHPSFMEGHLSRCFPRHFALGDCTRGFFPHYSLPQNMAWSKELLLKQRPSGLESHEHHAVHAQIKKSRGLP